MQMDMGIDDCVLFLFTTKNGRRSALYRVCTLSFKLKMQHNWRTVKVQFFPYCKCTQTREDWIKTNVICQGYYTNTEKIVQQHPSQSRTEMDFTKTVHCCLRPVSVLDVNKPPLCRVFRLLLTVYWWFFLVQSNTKLVLDRIETR